METNVAMYIPVKNDAIDKRLAEFINENPDKVRLASMFMRENGEGVY
jgi:hypothetical protein